MSQTLFFQNLSRLIPVWEREGPDHLTPVSVLLLLLLLLLLLPLQVLLVPELQQLLWAPHDGGRHRGGG